MSDESMFTAPDCTGCGAVSSETVAELHRAHAAARDEWQVQLTRAEAKALRMEKALRKIEALAPEPYQFPVDWNEQVASCADCRRFANHPIQQGICDTHRRPLWARDRHDANERASLGYRAMQLARKALEEE